MRCVIKYITLFFLIFILGGCQTIIKNDAPHLGKKLAPAKNRAKLVSIDDLDQYGLVNFQMAYQYYLAKDFDLALEKIDVVILRYAKFPEGHNLFGVIEEDRGRDDEALNHFKKAFELKPDYVMALSNYSRIFCKKGLDAMVLGVAAIRKGHAGLYAATGECAIRNNQPQLAIQYANDAININPKYGQAYYVKSLALAQLNEYASAISALNNFHNIHGYTEDSLKMGIQIATKHQDLDSIARYKKALQNFIGRAG